MNDYIIILLITFTMIYLYTLIGNIMSKANTGSKDGSIYTITCYTRYPTIFGCIKNLDFGCIIYMMIIILLMVSDDHN